MKKNETQVGVYQGEGDKWFFTLHQKLADDSETLREANDKTGSGFSDPAKAYFAAADALAKLKPV
jgi:hypothetical protein